PFELRLKLAVALVVGSGRDARDGTARGEDLVAMLLSDGDGFIKRDILRVGAIALLRPRAGLLLLVDAELQRAATGNAAEQSRELFVVLELQPVDERVLAAVRVHALQQFHAIQRLEDIWPELAPEGAVVASQLLGWGQRAFP